MCALRVGQSSVPPLYCGNSSNSVTGVVTALRGVMLLGVSLKMGDT